MLRKILVGTMAAAMVTGISVGSAMAKEKIKIALIEGMSGPFAASGQAALRELKFNLAKYVNNDKYEVEVMALDSKSSPKEAVVQFKNAVSQGVTYIFQGNSSGVAHALLSAVEKHNKRNPKKRVLFMNFAAVDPALTEKRCSFWHFRFDAHVGMKLQAMIGSLAADKSIKKVFIIGQDYSYGQSVAAGATGFLKALRPDIKIVGNELHPLGRVQDFTPYAKKIQASGAQAIIASAWGADMVRTAQAIGDAGIKAKVFTFYAAGTGITATIGKRGEGRILVVGEGKPNKMNDAVLAHWKEFKAKYPNNDLLFGRMVMISQMLSKAIKKAGSADVYKVAKAFEGMEHTRLNGAKVKMRAGDHQLLMALNLLAHTSKLPKYGDLVNDYDKSGFGLVSVATVPFDKTARPATCKIKVPAK